MSLLVCEQIQVTSGVTAIVEIYIRNIWEALKRESPYLRRPGGQGMIYEDFT